jgi:hypothetical protein
MPTVEQELRGDLSFDLHYLSWHLSYPIHPGIGLDSLFQALRDHGVIVQLNDAERRASVHLGYGDERPRLLETSVTYDDLILGWSGCVPSSPRAFGNSIFMVYDRLGAAGDLRDDDGWYTFRSREACTVEKRFDDYLLKAFGRHQETLLAPVKGPLPRPGLPLLVEQLTRALPASIIRRSMLDIGADRHNEFDEESENTAWLYPEDEEVEDACGVGNPSPEHIVDYCWGQYLQRLAAEKGYPLRPGVDIASLTYSGWNAMPHGSIIPWAWDGMPVRTSGR